MNWTLKFLPEAQKDFEQLAGNQKLLVAKALDKVVQNPVSIYEGGYGKPLGSKSGTDLSGLLKIKLRDAGLRIVYKLVRTETSMLVIVIGARAAVFQGSCAQGIRPAHAVQLFRILDLNHFYASKAFMISAVVASMESLKGMTASLPR